MAKNNRNITNASVFKTWGKWFSFIPILFGFVFAMLCAISTFIGFIVFTQSMGFSDLTGLLIATAVILSGIGLVALIAHFLAFRLFLSRIFRFGCSAIALVLAIGAFAYGVMISAYPVELTGKLFFGMTAASSPAFLAGWLGIWFVLVFQKELGMASEKDGKSNSITKESPSATIISLTKQRPYKRQR